MRAGYPEGKLLQAMAFNVASPSFQAVVPSYRFAAIPQAVRPNLRAAVSEDDHLSFLYALHINGFWLWRS